MIYRLLLGPFYCYDHTTHEQYISVYLSACRDNNWGGNVLPPHPHRTTPYTVEFQGPIININSDEKHTKVFIDANGLLNWLRGLGNVSYVVRQELAEVLWEKTEVELKAMDGDLSLLHHFMEDRPSAVHGIRRLVIEVWSASPTSRDEHSTARQRISELPLSELCPETLQVRLNMEIPELKSRAVVDELIKLRDIKVSKTFDLSMTVPSDGPATETELGFVAGMFRNIMAEVLLPLSLRDKKDKVASKKENVS